MRTRLFLLGMSLVLLIGAGVAAAATPAAPCDGRINAPLPGTAHEVIGADRLRTTVDAALVAGADYLRAMQADVTEDNAGNGTPPSEVPADPNDAGWDWVVTSPPAPFHHTTAASPTNTYGATVMGVYYAYLATGDYSYFTVMQDVADKSVAAGTASIRTASDMIFLMRFDDLPEVAGTTYMAAAKAKFDAAIALHGGTGTSYAQYVRDARGVTQGLKNGIIGWDIGAYAVAAGMLAERYPADLANYATMCDQMAEVLWQDSFNDAPGYFDIVDDAGWDPTYGNVNYWWYCLGVGGLIDAFRASGTHTAEIPGLVARLASSTYPSGAVSYSYGANTDDEDWQSTAYTAAVLAALDKPTYQTQINGMSSWLALTQDVSGGWKYSSGNHYPEVCGENTMGLFMGLPNTVTPTPEATCLSIGHPCNLVSFLLARSSAAPARGYSVTFQLSDDLALCNGALSDIVKGSYFDGYGYDAAQFEILDNGGGSYTADCAILGTPCGPTGNGTLFTVNVKKVGPPDGEGTITVTAFLLRDCDNQPIPVAPGAPGTITIDTTPPVALSDLSALQVKASNDGDGTTKVTVSFTPPSGGGYLTTAIYRKGFGNYPEYDDPPGAGSVPAIPATPALALAAGWVLAGSNATGSFVDETASRDFYYYVAFSSDACGNVSSVSNRTGGTLNYHLGDVAPGGGNNNVDGLDISLLGTNYGLTVGFNPIVDVGPTTNYTVDARPTTDNRINFEDLMMFSLNYGGVGKADLASVVLGSAGSGAIRLEAAPHSMRVRTGQTVAVPVLLRGEVDGVRGIHTVMTYDADRFAYVSSGVGSAIAPSEHFFKDLPSAGTVDVSVALLSRGSAISGEGEVVVVRLRALRDGVVTVGLKESSVRDVENRELLGRAAEQAAGRETEMGGVESGLAAYGLGEARPNPFTQRTVIGFEVPEAVWVRVVVYDVAGRLVRTLVDEERPAGAQVVEWDGRDDGGRSVGNGIYFYAMQAGAWQSQRRMTLLR
jgi:hypothetical protein